MVLEKTTVINILGEGDPFQDKYFEIVSGDFFDHDANGHKANSVTDNVIKQMTIKKVDVAEILKSDNKKMMDSWIKNSKKIEFNPLYIFDQNDPTDLWTNKFENYKYTIEDSNGSILDNLQIRNFTEINFDKSTIKQGKKYQVVDAEVYLIPSTNEYFATKLYLKLT